MSYPNNLETQSEFFQVKDFATSELQNELLNAGMVMTVIDGSKFPLGRFVTLLGKSELAIISSRVANVLTIEERGAFGTPIQSWPALTVASGILAAKHYELLRDGLLAVQGASWSYQKPVLAILNDPLGLTPVDGDAYLVGVGAGVWVGKNSQIARFVSGAWVYIVPSEGFTVQVATLGRYEFVGGVWLRALTSAELAVPGGIATLDSGGKIQTAQLPSYVDDVLEVLNPAALPAVGETGKIYVSTSTGETFRWTGSVYLEISSTELATTDPLNHGSIALVGTGLTAARDDHVHASSVLPFAALANFPALGDLYTIYIAIDTSSTYRWSGSAYQSIGGGGFTTGAAFPAVAAPGSFHWNATTETLFVRVTNGATQFWLDVFSSVGDQVNLSDFAASGVVGTAAATVDGAMILTFNQVTAGITVSLPTPTVPNTHKPITLENLSTSTAALTFNVGSSFALSPGMSQVVQWNGAFWAAMGVTNLIPEYGSVVYTGGNVTPTSAQNSATAAADFMSFTLPSAGVWEVTYTVNSYCFSTTANNMLLAAVYTSANTLLPGTELVCSSLNNTSGAPQIAISASGTGQTFITSTGAASYKVRVWNPLPNTGAVAISNAGGRSSVTWTKISGNLPVSGQTVDTLYVTRTGNQTQASNWSAKDIIFNTVKSGAIPYNIATGVATLTAGKTYNIRAGLAWSVGNNYGIRWALVDAASNVAISGLVEQVQATNGGFNTSAPTLDMTYTPVVDQTVKIRMTADTSMLSGETLRADLNTFMSITQVGSSSYSGTSIIGTPTLGQVLTAQADGTTAVWATPATPTTTSVALSYVKHSVGQVVAANSPFLFDTVLGGSMTRPNSGTWLLLAGVTYRLECSPGASTGGGNFNFQWRDTTNSVYLGNAATRMGVTSGNSAIPDLTNAVAVVTPLTNMLVQLWAASATGAQGQGATDSANSFSWAQVVQLGSNAYSGVPIVGTGTFGQTLAIQADGVSAGWSTPGAVTTSSVDTLHAGIGSAAPAAGNALTLTTVSGNLGLVANAITLLAGKTYHLQAGITRTNGVNGSSEFTYIWRNLTNNVYLGAEGSITQNTALGAGGTASALVTPATPIMVALWCVKNTNVSSIGSNNGGGGTTAAGYAIVTQLGSNAYSGVNLTNTGTVGMPLLSAGDGSAAFGNFTGGVTSAAGVLTVQTNANLTGAVTSIGNVTSLGVATNTSTTVAVLAASASKTALATVTTPSAGSFSINGNVQLQARPALMCAQATVDLNALLTAALAMTTTQTTAPTIGTGTLVPGVYNFGANAVQLTGNLTLSGTATDFWVFKTTAAFATTAGNSTITITGGATAANVFWVIGNNAPSLGSSTTFRGTLINTAAISVGASTTVEGRLLTTAGAISVGSGSTMTVPAGVCTVLPMGVLSTFLAYTVAGACATTSAIQNYGDVGSGNTAPSAWETYNLCGNVYGPTSMAFRAAYSLFVNGVDGGGTRTIENRDSALMAVALDTLATATSGQSVQIRGQVHVGQAVITDRFLSILKVA